MEGPSLLLAAEQLAPFKNLAIKTVEGNTKIGKERLLGKTILDIFSCGKHLFFQFDTFALKIHFLLFGSFQATVNKKKVTGDYPAKTRTPRLALKLKNGHVEMFSCSIHFVEEADAKSQCDYTIDIMSDQWDSKKALAKLKKHPESEIADVLLDQTIFLGVGNIIKNEVLFLAGISPLHKISDLSVKKLKEIIEITHNYVFQFYEWRKHFELRKHYQIYHQKTCKKCGNKISKTITGVRKRYSYICSVCEK